VVSNSSFTDGISGSYDVTEQDYSTALVDNAIYQFGDFTGAEDNPTGIDSDVSLANGDRIEIDTVPGEYTNFLEVTPSGSGDLVETWGSSTPQLLWDSLTTSQFPSEVFNIADYLTLTRGSRISTRRSLPA
jgi:hypothetical protein